MCRWAFCPPRLAHEKTSEELQQLVAMDIAKVHWSRGIDCKMLVNRVCEKHFLDIDSNLPDGPCHWLTSIAVAVSLLIWDLTAEIWGTCINNLANANRGPLVATSNIGEYSSPYVKDLDIICLSKLRSSERSRSRGNSSDGTQEPDDTNLWPFVNWAPVFFNACGMPAEQYAHALSQPLATCFNSGTQPDKWPKQECTACVVLHVGKRKEALCRAKVVGTACTGSAAPSFALDQIVGAHNFSEVIASESHAPWFLFYEEQLRTHNNMYASTAGAWNSYFDMLGCKTLLTRIASWGNYTQVAVGESEHAPSIPWPGFCPVAGQTASVYQC